MAVLRVSSYRKLFEEDGWSGNGGLSVQCAGQYRASLRGAAGDKCDCDKLDFVAAKALNKEGLSRFVQDRTVISALNDRLARLIELAHCFEEENESLELQIVQLEERLNSQRAPSSITSAVAQPGYSLDAVVERLRKQRDEILCYNGELQKELECLKKECEKVAQQRILIQQERLDVAELADISAAAAGPHYHFLLLYISDPDNLPARIHNFATKHSLHEVDAVTAECLALREQVAIYEEQLANMEAQHKTEVESLLEPDEGTTGAVAIRFGSPDIAPALDVKEYYCQLAESLQFECGASSSAVVLRGDGKELEVGGTAGSRVKDFPKMKDVSEIKMLISELQKELAELEKCNEELEDEVEMKKAAYMDQIAELECTIDEMRYQEADFQAQMKEQCEDYKELLSEKMARDMEIVAYRSLVEEEEERLCSL